MCSPQYIFSTHPVRCNDLNEVLRLFLYSFFPAATTTNVDCRLRLKRLQQRKKKNLIYHYVNVTRPYATVNVQIKTVHIDSSR